MKMGKNRAAYLALMISTAVGASLACPGIAHAQQAGASEAVAAEKAGVPNPAETPSTQQATAMTGGETDGQRGELEEIIVTAPRSSERAQDVPIAITTVTAQRLNDLTVRDVVDIQKVTPGLFVATAQVSGKAKIAIRGQV